MNKKQKFLVLAIVLLTITAFVVFLIKTKKKGPFNFLKTSLINTSIKAWVTPETQNVEPDQDFDVNIYIDMHSESLAAYHFQITYDPTIITIDTNRGEKGITKGADAKNYMTVVNSMDINNGHYQLAGITSKDNINKTGQRHIVTIHLKALGGYDKKTIIGLTVKELANNNGQSLLVDTVKNATIYVNKNALPAPRVVTSNTTTSSSLLESINESDLKNGNSDKASIESSVWYDTNNNLRDGDKKDISSDKNALSTSSVVAPSATTHTPLLESINESNLKNGNSDKASIESSVWYDTNNNNLQDENEKGVSNVRVCALGNNKNYCTITNKQGKYEIKNLNKGTYTIRIKADNNLFQTYTPNNKKGTKIKIKLRKNNKYTQAAFGYRKISQKIASPTNIFTRMPTSLSHFNFQFIKTIFEFIKNYTSNTTHL